jgi:hypothetical protein
MKKFLTSLKIAKNKILATSFALSVSATPLLASAAEGDFDITAFTAKMAALPVSVIAIGTTMLTVVGTIVGVRYLLNYSKRA